GAAPCRDGRARRALHAPRHRRRAVAHHATAARFAAADSHVRTGHVGARSGGVGLACRPRALARTLDRTVIAVSKDLSQSAAAPAPFNPTADYAFLSNCTRGALIAPDGAIDWLCVPRFDSPSVFASILDRE